MKKMMICNACAVALSLSLLAPTISNAQAIQGEHKTIVGKIIALLAEEVRAVEKLLVLHHEHGIAGLASVSQQFSQRAPAQTKNCRTHYEEICPLSPFGTRNEPAIERATSTVPAFTIKFVTVNANLATIAYSISDIRDNQTAYWLNYGISPSTLEASTPSVNVSYGITNKHGIDNAAFVIGFPPEEICAYPEIDDETYGNTPLYQPDPPVYYFRIEAENNLGTFFTPSLDLPPFSFQFDNVCGEETYYYEHGLPID